MNIVLPAAATQSHVDAICCPAGNHRGTSGSRYSGLGSTQFRSGGPGQRRSSLMEGSRRPSLYTRNARLPTQLHGSQDPVVNKSCRVQYASPTSATVLPNDWCQQRSQCLPNVCPCFAASVSKTPRGAQGCAQALSVANVAL